MLKRGEYCVDNDLDNEAMRIYTSLLDSYCDPQGEEAKDIYLSAIEGLCRLRETDNEYIWETTGRYIYDYYEWLEKQ